MRHPRPGFIRAAAGGQLLLPAAEPATASTADRTVRGVVVPYGPAGHTSGGRLRFSRGSLSWVDPKRVKLLREHNQAGDVVGYATELTETDAGLVATFYLPETPAGDAALLEASYSLRDGFSVGVQLDDATLERLRKSRGAAVEAAGALREVSLVSVPAFDDARMAAAGVDLVVTSWTPHTPDPRTTTAGAAGTPREDTPVNRRQRLAALRAQTTLTQDEAAELQQLAALPDAELDQPHTPEAAAPAAPAGPNTEAGAAGLATAAAGGFAGPSVVPAAAAAAVVTSEPATYTFGAGGPSIVRDLYNSAMRGDGEAAGRVERFNAELADGNPASLVAFVTAAATRDNYDGAGTDVPSVLVPDRTRPILREQLDAKRPWISRLDTVPITDAQPFAVPGVEAEFDGVGDHTEGTPHRPAGRLTLSGGGVVQPGATSGAWEVSRELVDATNPVIDRIAARAMLNDYRRKSEGKLVTLLNTFAGQDGVSIYGVDTLMGLRGALIDFVNDDDEGADLIALSGGLFRRYGTELDADDRPQLPFVGAVNAVGTMRAGGAGFTIDGAEPFVSRRLDTQPALGGNAGIIARSEGILWAESPVLQFRFDEVLGPGVIKLALWAYTGAAIIDQSDVAVIRTGAGVPDPAP